MAAGDAGNTGQRRLTSWKEIAAFVGRDERTVKRWEVARGLPVRRVPGAGRASVFAYADEIDAWLNGGTPPARAAPGLDQPAFDQPALDNPAGEGTVETEAPAPSPPVKPFARRAAPWASLALFCIVAAVAASLAPRHRSPGSGHVPDPVAAEFYQSGRHAWQTRTPSGLARAIADFSRAVARDPHYAAAYGGLADAYDLEAEFTAMPAALAYPRARAAALRAIALDPSLAEAHTALAFADFYGSRDAAGAEREFRRALALAPSSAGTHHWYATVLLTQGAYDAALSEIEKAERLDSESSAIPADKALILFYAGRPAEAVKLLTQIEEDQPSFASPHQYLASIWLLTGKDALYLRERMLGAAARRDGLETAIAQAGARGLAPGGHAGMLRAILSAERAQYDKGRLPAYQLAETCAELGDANAAFAWLAISIARREPDTVGLKTSPVFKSLRADSRFAPLLRKAGW